MMFQKLVFIASLLVLQSCMSHDEVRQYFEGSWEGSNEQQSWCSTFTIIDKETMSADVYIKYPRKGEEQEDHIISYSWGYIAANRGLRFKLSLERTHDDNGVEIASDKRTTSRSYYVVADHSDNQFTYQQMEGGDKQDVNRRVANCNGLKTEFEMLVASASKISQ